MKQKVSFLKCQNHISLSATFLDVKLIQQANMVRIRKKAIQVTFKKVGHDDERLLISPVFHQKMGDFNKVF